MSEATSATEILVWDGQAFTPPADPAPYWRAINRITGITKPDGQPAQWPPKRVYFGPPEVDPADHVSPVPQQSVWMSGEPAPMDPFEALFTVATPR